MGLINLADAKVTYEGQTLPAINLISKLQTQLREAACRIATIAETLGDLQVALLNSHTVEVRLTLSREDYESFKSMEGMDDNERIRKAVMTVIHPEEAGITGDAVELRPSATVAESKLTSLPIESTPMISKSAEPNTPSVPALQPAERIPQGQPIPPVTVTKPTTQCPTCHSLIELPATLNGEWLVELTCGTCGAKCLVKPSSRQS